MSVVCTETQMFRYLLRIEGTEDLVAYLAVPIYSRINVVMKVTWCRFIICLPSLENKKHSFLHSVKEIEVVIANECKRDFSFNFMIFCRRRHEWPCFISARNAYDGANGCRYSFFYVCMQNFESSSKMLARFWNNNTPVMFRGRLYGKKWINIQFWRRGRQKQISMVTYMYNVALGNQGPVSVVWITTVGNLFFLTCLQISNVVL